MTTALIRPQILNEAEERFIFYCPGCDSHHWIRTRGSSPIWSMTGGLDKPTVDPSILIPLQGHRCHLYLRAGRIEYLSDCDHALKGKTVDMIPIIW